MEEKRKRGPRGINYVKRANRIKEEVDQLVNAMLKEKRIEQTQGPTGRIKISAINFDDESTSTLLEIQARLSRVLLERSKRK